MDPNVEAPSFFFTIILSVRAGYLHTIYKQGDQHPITTLIEDYVLLTTTSVMHINMLLF